MLYEMDNYISNDLGKRFPAAIGQRVKYTTNTGMALVSTANANLDGSGTIVSVLTPASNGTLIKSITIKGIVTSSRGMVRLFIYDFELFTKHLIREIDIKESTTSGVHETFSIKVPLNLMLSTTWGLAASTQNAESFQVIAEGLDLVFP